MSSPDDAGIRCPPMCDFVVDEFRFTRLVARPAGGSHLLVWDNCPQQDGPDCVLPPSPGATGVSYLICATFVVTSAPAPGPPDCPPRFAECGDGFDNDGDRRVDHPADPGCSSREDTDESNAPVGPPRLGARCTIPGSPSGETIRGTAGSDVICGNGGNDRIYGLGGADLLVGGGGADRLYGGAGRDRIVGGAGSDTLDGGASEDIFLAGTGADTLLARDRARDTGNGGSGRDRARVDRVDRLTAIERRF